MLKKLFLILQVAFFILACQASAGNDLHNESIELQRQANEEATLGIAERDNDRLSKAVDLIKLSLAADPSNHAARLTWAQIAVYRQNYKIALCNINDAYSLAPNDDSLPLFRCMLIEEIEGGSRGKECYSTIEKSYAEQHRENNQIPTSWVGAAILADSHAAQELIENYFRQEKAKGELEEEMAEMTIESLQDGSYVDQVLMR